MIADNDNALEAQKRMNDAAIKLSSMAGDVATARQIKDFSDERKKRALSVLVVAELKAGRSVGAAEHYARSQDSWGAALADLGEQLKSALKVLEEHDCLKTIYEASRSVLALEREKMRL